jgi:hypothetical protein
MFTKTCDTWLKRRPMALPMYFAGGNGASEIPSVDGAVQQFAGALLRILEVLDRLLADHLQLPLQFSFGEGAVEDDVGRQKPALCAVGYLQR